MCERVSSRQVPTQNTRDEAGSDALGRDSSSTCRAGGSGGPVTGTSRYEWIWQMHPEAVSLFNPDAEPVDVDFGRSTNSPSARTLQRRASAGGSGLVRIRAGVFAEKPAWDATSSLEQYRARIRAVVGTRSARPVLCRESAAAIWGIPRLGLWPEQVHLADVGRTRPRSRNGVVWHQDRIDADEVVEIDGYFVTDLARTLVDLARVTTFLGAVVALDAGVRSNFQLPNGERVRGATKDVLMDRLETATSTRGRRAARSAIEFCDGASGSVGESLSRGQMHLLGVPAPRLQVRMPRPDGPDDIVDFDWPEFGLFGEFDGNGKYLRSEYLGDMDTADAVIAEKRREDRIRRRHRPFAVRWGWNTALRQRRLARRMDEAGLPRYSPGHL